MEPRATPDRTSVRQHWWWIFDPRYSLRARAALIFGGGILIFTLLVSWITGTIYKRALQTSVGVTFETLAFQVSDKLDRVMYERYRTLLLAAALPALRNPAAAPTDRRRVLEALQEATPEFAWIGFADPSGRIVASNNTLFEGTDASTRGWFVGALQRPYIGGLRQIPELAREVLSAPEGETVPRYLDLAVPVFGIDGKLVGVLGSHLAWSWAHEIQRSVVPELAARDRIGVTVYHGSDVLLDSGGLGWTYPPDAPSVGEGSRFRGWMMEKTAVGPVFVTGFSRSRGIREYRGVGWLTLVRQPIERALGSVAPLQRSIVAWGVVLSLLAAVASWVVAGRHTRRFRTMGGAAERIREGDILAVLPHPTDESEISVMCRSLSNLVEDLRGHQEKLRAENAHLRPRAPDREPAQS